MSEFSSGSSSAATSSSPASAAATTAASSAVTRAAFCLFALLFPYTLLFSLEEGRDGVGDIRYVSAHLALIPFAAFAALAVCGLHLDRTVTICDSMLAALFAIAVSAVCLVLETSRMRLSAGWTLPVIELEDMQSVFNLVGFAAYPVKILYGQFLHLFAAAGTVVRNIAECLALLAESKKEERKRQREEHAQTPYTFAQVVCFFYDSRTFLEGCFACFVYSG